MTQVQDPTRRPGVERRAHLPVGFPSLPGDDELDAALRLAAAVTGADYSAINLADRDQIHQYAGGGSGWSSQPWGEGLCETTVLSGRTVVVEDATLVAPFDGSPWVDGRLGQVRAYASAPLLRDGLVVGSLCVAGNLPRHWGAGRVSGLHDVAQLVVAALDRRWALVELENAHRDVLRAHEQLAGAQAFNEALLEALPVGVVAADAQQRVTLFNRVSRLWHGHDTDPGLAPEDLPAAYDLFEADGVTPLVVDRVPLLRTYREGRVTDAEIVVRPHGQRARLVSCSGSQIRDADGALVGAVLAMADVTDQRAMELRLRSAALHDPLTGLPNRDLLLDRLDHALQASERDGVPVVLMFADLDGFKAVNDRHGHAVGDEVLVQAGQRLLATVRPGDTVARVGGDEFVLLCSGLADGGEIGQLVDRVGRSFLEPFGTSAGPQGLGISVGGVPSTPGVSAKDLLVAADEAMYGVKRTRSPGVRGLT